MIGVRFPEDAPIKGNNVKAEVTEQEYMIARMLGDVWNLFLKLPNEHPMQNQEFCTAIHRCQDIVLSRAGIRAIKEHDIKFCKERECSNG